MEWNMQHPIPASDAPGWIPTQIASQSHVTGSRTQHHRMAGMFDQDPKDT
jgi:hypothetical protein